MIVATDRFVFALDPSRFGEDETILAVRRGMRLHTLIAWRMKSTMETVGRVIVEMKERGVHVRPPDDSRETRRALFAPAWQLVVDEVGLGGGIVDRFREQGITVTAFNGGASPSEKGRERYLNARAESYFVLRELLDTDQAALPRDPLLWEELLATQYGITSSGKIQLEAKDDIKARIGRSPDRADAVTMAFSAQPPRQKRRRYASVSYHTYG